MIKYRKKIKRGLLFLVMVFLSFVVNIPNISMIGTALKPFGGYMSDKSLFPSNPDFSMLRKSLRKESKVVQTKKQYGDFSLTALSFASISIFSG